MFDLAIILLIIGYVGARLSAHFEKLEEIENRKRQNREKFGKVEN